MVFSEGREAELRWGPGLLAEERGMVGAASASQRRCINRPGSRLEEEERETMKLHPSIFFCSCSVAVCSCEGESCTLDGFSGKVTYYRNKLTGSAHRIYVK